MAEITKIVGTAYREKAGIAIHADKVYYVKNEKKWEEAFFDHKVEIEGYLSQTSNPHVLPPSDDGIIRQGITTYSEEEYKQMNVKNWVEIVRLTLLD